MDILAKLMKEMTGLIFGDRDNRLENGVRIFDPPLVGVAAAADPLFAEFKKEEIIGKIFRLPGEWLPSPRSVIAYFLPFTKEIRRSNYSGEETSDLWMHGRFKGENFNNKLRRQVVEAVEKYGGKAVAPATAAEFALDDRNLCSNWSERHAAYVAGLGTFGLNGGLITAKGMAGRFGSVITDLDVEPACRKYKGAFDYCLFLQDGSCGACIERCPAGAITSRGGEKNKCHYHLMLREKSLVLCARFNYPYAACGKCQTNVPCEERIPRR